MDYEKILDTCSVGDLVYIDDGLIALKVTGKDSTSLFTGGYYNIVVLLNALLHATFC